MGLRRIIGSLWAFANLAFACLLILPWLATKPQSRVARRLERLFFGWITKGFGLDVRCEGRAAPHALFIANHISWADIPVLASVLDADFVAKSEIRQWPLIGWLARRYNPVFIDRERRGRAGAHAAAVRQRLEDRRSVILCPEGTTSVGTAILPFRTSLFSVADDAAIVQPVVIRYLDRAGNALCTKRQREVAWIDDDDLLSGAARVAREHILVKLVFLPPMKVSDFPDRKALAEAAHAAMSKAYATAPKRPR